MNKSKGMQANKLSPFMDILYLQIVVLKNFNKLAWRTSKTYNGIAI